MCTIKVNCTQIDFSSTAKTVRSKSVSGILKNENTIRIIHGTITVSIVSTGHTATVSLPYRILFTVLNRIKPYFFSWYICYYSQRLNRFGLRVLCINFDPYLIKQCIMKELNDNDIFISLHQLIAVVWDKS